MGSIIIAMPKYDDAERIAGYLKESDIWEPVRICRKGSDVLLAAENEDVDAVICTKRLSDMGYEELSAYLPVRVNMLLMTSDAGLLPFSSSITKLLLPFRKKDLVATVKMILPQNSSYTEKRKKPPRSKEEQELIEKAKGILMNNNEMSEPEAFRYIQKSSMDYGRTLLETAAMIIALNEEY